MPEYARVAAGCISEWPGGFAMALGPARFGGVERCCDGHPTPQAAKEHGLGRLVEVAARIATAEVEAWEAAFAANPPEERASGDVENEREVAGG